MINLPLMAAPIQGDNDHWYDIVFFDGTFQDAIKHAANRNGFLASITTEAESQFINQRLLDPICVSDVCQTNHVDGFWLGGVVNEQNQWQWYTGEHMEYTPPYMRRDTDNKYLMYGYLVEYGDITPQTPEIVYQLGFYEAVKSCQQNPHLCGLEKNCKPVIYQANTEKIILPQVKKHDKTKTSKIELTTSFTTDNRLLFIIDNETEINISVPTQINSNIPYEQGFNAAQLSCYQNPESCNINQICELIQLYDTGLLHIPVVSIPINDKTFSYQVKLRQRADDSSIFDFVDATYLGG